MPLDLPTVHRSHALGPRALRARAGFCFLMGVALASGVAFEWQEELRAFHHPQAVVSARAVHPQWQAAPDNPWWTASSTADGGWSSQALSDLMTERGVPLRAQATLAQAVWQAQAARWGEAPPSSTEWAQRVWLAQAWERPEHVPMSPALGLDAAWPERSSSKEKGRFRPRLLEPIGA